MSPQTENDAVPMTPYGSDVEIEGATLASAVYQQLRNDILAGELRPGEKLRTQYLCQRYAVGNSPLREALNRLSSDGFVVREDQRGFHVATVSKPELMELVRTRCWLEAIALRESIESGDVTWEEELVLAFHRFSRIGRSLSEEEYIANPEWDRVHRDFHMTLISACGSRYLQSYCGQLFDQADRYRRLGIVVAFPNRNQVDEHRAILDAAVQRQADEAVRLLCAHYNRTLDIILQSEFEFADDGAPT